LILSFEIFPVFIFFLHGTVDVGKFVHNIRPYFSLWRTFCRRAANEQLYSTMYNVFHLRAGITSDSRVITGDWTRKFPAVAT